MIIIILLKHLKIIQYLLYTEDVNDKKIYYFKASDIGNVLGIVNIRTSIMNFDEEDDERVIRKAYDTEKRIQDTIFLSSQGVYRLLYNSKKEVAKNLFKNKNIVLLI